MMSRSFRASVCDVGRVLEQAVVRSCFERKCRFEASKAVMSPPAYKKRERCTCIRLSLLALNVRR